MADSKETAKLNKMRKELSPPLESLGFVYDDITMEELSEIMKDPANKELFKGCVSLSNDVK